MPQESGEQSKKLPERADALKIALPFEEAVKAALSVDPIPKERRKPTTGKRGK